MQHMEQNVHVHKEWGQEDQGLVPLLGPLTTSYGWSLTLLTLQSLCDGYKRHVWLLILYYALIIYSIVNRYLS